MLNDPVGVVGLGVIELVNTVVDVGGTGIENASSVAHVAHSTLLLPRQNFVFDNINSMCVFSFWVMSDIVSLYFIVIYRQWAGMLLYGTALHHFAMLLSISLGAHSS